MSTIKISQLPAASVIQANTSNTIFAGVDLVAGTTYAYSAKILATGLYSNTSLVVGQNQSLFPNTIAQFSLSGASYVQTNFVNLDGGGSADHVITANNGTDSTYFLDLGLANPAYQPGLEYNNIGTSVSPLDGYLYVQGGTTPGLFGGNLILGTTTTSTQIKFIVGGGTSSNIVAKMNNTGLVMNGNTSITTSNLYATGNIVTNVITTPLGSSSNLLIDPDGPGDLVTSANTELLILSTAAATSLSSGAVQVSGGASVTGNIWAGSINTTGNVNAGNVFASYLFGNVVGSSIANTIQWLALTNAPTQASGQLWYSSVDSALIEDTDIAGDRPIIGKVLFERVYNGTGSTIAANSWVRLAGPVTSNAIPYIQLADATNSTNATALGVVKNAINNGSYGFVYNIGVLNNLNLSNFSGGDLIFLSTTPGVASNVAPTGANVVVALGKVLNNGSSNGKLQILITQAPQYGKPNGAIMYANNNVLVASNTITINDSTQTLTMNGSISMTGGIVTVNNNTFGPTLSAMRIDGSAGFAAQATTQSGTMMQVIGLANTPTRIIVDSYSVSGNAYSLIAGRGARGNAAAPIASQSGDVLSRFSGNGYGATGYSPLGVGRMDFVAAENYTDTNKGSFIQFAATPIGSNVISSNVVTISATGLTTNNITANTITANAVSSTLSTVGTWTPNVQFTTQGTVTYTANTGSFVKTGRQVFAYFTLSASTSGSSGNMSIANLPFSSATTAGTVGITTIVGSVIGPSTGNMGYISGNVSSGASNTQLYVTVTSGPGSSNEPVTGGTGTGGIGTPFTISGVISYISAS